MPLQARHHLIRLVSYRMSKYEINLNFRRCIVLINDKTLFIGEAPQNGERSFSLSVARVTHFLSRSERDRSEHCRLDQ